MLLSAEHSGVLRLLKMSRALDLQNSTKELQGDQMTHISNFNQMPLLPVGPAVTSTTLPTGRFPPLPLLKPAHRSRLLLIQGC